MIIQGIEPLIPGMVYTDKVIYDPKIQSYANLPFMVIEEVKETDFLEYLKEINHLHFLIPGRKLGPLFYRISVD